MQIPDHLEPNFKDFKGKLYQKGPDGDTFVIEAVTIDMHTRRTEYLINIIKLGNSSNGLTGYGIPIRASYGLKHGYRFWVANIDLMGQDIRIIGNSEAIEVLYGNR
jgi:hypothetical protein